jgi:hypothetical protein
MRYHGCAARGHIANATDPAIWDTQAAAFGDARSGTSTEA